jgi:beta-lactamase superfamily II metal-dependent hydrolase
MYDELMQSKTKNQAKSFNKHSTAYSIALCFGVILLSAGSWLFAYVWHWQNRSHVLEIYCFKPDSGSTATEIAIFIRTPEGKTALIDGGKSDAIIHDLTSVMPFYDRTIDTLILTNDDDSHATGLVAVLGRYHVGQVYEMAVPATSSSAYTEFENILAHSLAKNAIHEEVGEGDTMNIGEFSAKVIFPPALSTVSTASTTDFKFSKTNAPTLAFSLTYGSTTLFFGGLITKIEQKYIAATMASSSNVSSSTILILPKGENISAVDEGFFSALHPNIVVISRKPRSVTVKSDTAMPAVVIATTTKTGKIKKQSKPPKPPFDISTMPDISITNLAIDGDVEFISDGSTFIEKNI